MTPPFALVEFGALDAERRGALEGDEDNPFDAAGSTLRYRPKERHVGLEDSDGRLVASTGLLVVEVQAGGSRFPVVGVGGVIVALPQRGRGLARQVVGAALDLARTLGPAFAMLFCLPDRAGFYRKLGFAEVDGRVRVAQPGGSVVMPHRTMWQGLSDGAIWPAGEVVVDGLPF